MFPARSLQWLTRRTRLQQHPARPRRRCPLQCEALEDRQAPAVLTVTTTADTHQDGFLTLREAVAQANSDALTGQSDTIVFDESLGIATITLTGGQLTLSGANPTATEAIDGAGRITVSGNHSSRVFQINGGVQADLSGLTITGGSADSGAGINTFGRLTIHDSILSDNTASSQGGGLESYAGSTVDVTNSTITGNSTPGNGGGMFLDAPTTITGCTITGNSAFNGGAFDVQPGAVLTITDSALHDNDSTIGGAIDSYSVLTIVNSAITSNAGGFGGGIFTYEGQSTGSLTLINTTLSDNTAMYGGGGLYIDFIAQGTSLTLTNDTITNNRANTSNGTSHGGGLGISGLLAPPTLQNTIVAGNFNGSSGNSPDDVNGSLNPASSYNLIGDGTGMSGISNGVNGNIVGVSDPGLGDLGDYGGPTLTVPLLPGSPAINAGTANGAPATDQRGVPRGTVISMGAFQATATQLILSGLPPVVRVGMQLTLTVTAADPFGQTAVGYRGTVALSSSDASALLPPDYTFTAGDAGSHTYAGGIAFFQIGRQTLTARDVANADLSTTAIVKVRADKGSGPDFNSAGAALQTVGQPFPWAVTTPDGNGNLVAQTDIDADSFVTAAGTGSQVLAIAPDDQAVGNPETNNDTLAWDVRLV